jgi:hypothetical protein
MNYRALTLIFALATAACNAQVSNAPDVAFKLATFAVDGRDRIGMLVDGTLLDVQQANAFLVENADVAPWSYRST